MKRKQKEKIKYDITNEVVQQKYNNIKCYVICINRQIDKDLFKFKEKILNKNYGDYYIAAMQ